MITNHVKLELFHTNYYALEHDLFDDLRYFAEYLSTDFRYYDTSFLEQAISFYNSSYIYHDMQIKNLYIGLSMWEIDTDIPVPCDFAFPDYVRATHNCKISVDNYLDFRKKWKQLKQDLPPFALIYSDDSAWIDCKGFDTQEEMEACIKDPKNQVIGWNS